MDRLHRYSRIATILLIALFISHAESGSETALSESLQHSHNNTVVCKASTRESNEETNMIGTRLSVSYYSSLIQIRSWDLRVQGLFASLYK